MKIQFDTPPSTPQETNGVAVRYAAAKRQVPQWRWYLLLGMVLALPAYLLVRFAMSYWWESTPAQVVLEQMVLRAPISGRIVQTLDAGAAVAAGSAVLRIAPPETASLDSTRTPPPAPQPSPPSARDIANAAATRSAAAARLRLLEESEQIARQQLALHQQRVQRMQTLMDQAAATRQEVEAMRLQALQAQTDLSRARADLGEHRATMARDAALARQQAQEAAAPAVSTTTLPADTSAPETLAMGQGIAITAPVQGTVLRVVAHAGEWVQAGSEVAILQGGNEPMVHAYLPADQSRYAQPGRMATLQFMDGRKLRARVVGVVGEAQSTPADRVSPLSPRPPSIVTRLEPLEPIPEAYRIHALPLDVRFDWVRKNQGWW